MSDTMLSTDYLQRFSALGRLYGKAALYQLRKAHVAVVGVGGVGSWTVEALARSGVGEITMIDMDDVCITNTNRQLPAINTTIGRPKVEVLAERVQTIFPECKIHAVPLFFSENNAEDLLSPDYDFIVDAIDRVSLKALLIARSVTKNKRILTVGGAGGKRDATQIRVTDLADSEGDNLLRQVRRTLRREYAFLNNKKIPFGVASVFSKEKPVYPWSDGSVRCEPDREANLKLDCAGGYGTAVFVTGAFGLVAAGEVVRQLVGA